MHGSNVVFFFYSRRLLSPSASVVSARQCSTNYFTGNAAIIDSFYSIRICYRCADNRVIGIENGVLNYGAIVFCNLGYLAIIECHRNTVGIYCRKIAILVIDLLYAAASWDPPIIVIGNWNPNRVIDMPE